MDLSSGTWPALLDHSTHSYHIHCMSESNNMAQNYKISQLLNERACHYEIVICAYLQIQTSDLFNLEYFIGANGDIVLRKKKTFVFKHYW